MVRIAIIACFFALATLNARAQAVTGAATVVKLFRQVQVASMKTGSISYRLQYTYANESSPTNILDSLNGDIAVSAGSYRCILDSTETIYNKNYTIILFKRDKLMCLYKPGGGTGNFFNSLAMLDSSLANIPGLNCSVTNSGGYRIAGLKFPAGFKYREIYFTVDTATSLLTHVRYVIKTSALTGLANSTEVPDGYDEYGVIDIKLFGYDYTGLNAGLTDEKNFFYKENGKYMPTNPYAGYRVFLGTPGL